MSVVVSAVNGKREKEIFLKLPSLVVMWSHWSTKAFSATSRCSQ